MTISRLRLSSIAFSVLVTLAAGAQSIAATAASPATDVQFKAFKIGSYDAVALYDGTLNMPNDGKSFVADQPPAAVASALGKGGAPTDHFEFPIEPLLVRAGDRVLLFDTGAGPNFGDIAGKLTRSMAAAGVDPAAVTDIFI